MRGTCTLQHRLEETASWPSNMQALLESCIGQHRHDGCRPAIAKRNKKAPRLAHQSTAMPHGTIAYSCQAVAHGRRASSAQHILSVKAKLHKVPFQGASSAGAGNKRCCRTRALLLAQHSDLAVWTSLSVCAAAAQVSSLNLHALMSAVQEHS